MRLCEDKSKGKTAHFRLPYASQKRRVLNLPNDYEDCNADNDDDDDDNSDDFIFIGSCNRLLL